MRARFLLGLSAITVVAVVAISALVRGNAQSALAGENVPPQTTSRWVSIGPAPLAYAQNPTNPANFNSGRVAAIAVDPQNANRWLLGAGNGGLWETVDGGASWAPIADAAPTLAIGSVAFAPSDPQVIYAGTGESAAVGFTKIGLGMLRSSDGGETWTLLGASSLARATIKRVRVHPADANVLLAATARGGVGRDSREGAASPPPYGILKSADGAVSWVRTLAGQATALEVDPTNFNRQYAAIADQRVGVLTDTPGAVTNGLYRSVDGGDSWSFVSGPWGASGSPTTSTVGRIELALSSSNPNVLYASIQIPPNGGTSSTGLLGLFRTDNAWAPTPTWIEVPQPTGTGGFCGPGKCGYSHVISVHPTGPDLLFAGGGEYGMWRCASCGAVPVWTKLTASAPVHPDHHAIAWAGTRLIDGNDGGVWSTSDLGASWENHNSGLSTALFFSAALHPTNSEAILGGIRDFQATVRTAGLRWSILPQVASWEWGEAEVALATQKPDTHWMLAWLYGAIQRTTDGGATGIQADAGIIKAGAAFVAPVRKCPANDEVFLTGTNRVWRTNDFFTSTAPTWTANGPAHPFQFPDALIAPGTILAIAFSPSDPSCATYAYANRGGDLYLTRDAGQTWTDLDPFAQVPSRPINGLAFHPANADVLYAVLSSFDNATPGASGHVFKTSNALAAVPAWTNTSPPADQPFNVVAIDPRNANRVYAGSDTGLWLSDNAGASWIKQGIDVGIPNVPIYDIQINPATDRTIAFTYGRGAYMLMTETTVEPPSNLHVVSIVGNAVTIAFTPPTSGPTPTGYVLEGGAIPGQVLGSAAIPGGVTTFTFAAPTGAFYIRVHVLSAVSRSVASNEVRIFVNVPAPPSAPANLLGLVNGSALSLSWMNTASGGVPSRIVLDASGSFVGSLTLPVSETTTFNGVPPGTYTLSLRAQNNSGMSSSSNSVTLSVPASCSGAPGTPQSFAATKTGSKITLNWNLPGSGAAPTGFLVTVSGSFDGAFPVSGRSLAGIVGPGSYTLSVTATNACGSSPPTPPQTVVVP